MRASKGSQFERDRKFWTEVIKKGPSICWLFKGTLIKGYGQFGFRGRRWLAHRYSFEFEYGAELPSNVCVLHSCDNPKCVNPDHLFLGDRNINAQDKVEKGRQQRGEDIPQSRLSTDVVLEIRERYHLGDITLKELAKEFSVDLTTISCLVRGHTWKHVGGPLTLDGFKKMGLRQRTERVIRICLFCKNPFSVRKSRKNRYCSYSCSGRGKAIERKKCQ